MNEAQGKTLFRANLCLGLALLALCGCTGPLEYVRNGFKVGPNFRQPPAAVESKWLDAADRRMRSDEDNLDRWWGLFDDPNLNGLVDTMVEQNLTLRQAIQRVLEARAQLGIATGNLFPQSQQLQASFTRVALSGQDANVIFHTPLGVFALKRFYSQVNLPVGAMSWEIDLWGRFRRAIEANSANLDGSVADYQDALVTLLSDTAASYVSMRTLQKQIEYTQANADLQRQTLTIVEARYKAGTVTGVDLRQARSTLAQTESQVPELQIAVRQTQNHLCTLMGVPPENLQAKLGAGKIPTAPPEVGAGIPAELLRRRPDIRRAERRAASQSAEIGVAEADFYPAFIISGNLGWSAQQFKDLWAPTAFYGAVGPSFQWNILNYGRILNNVRLQKSKLGEAVAAYQETVLKANQEVEDGLIAFFNAQKRAHFLTISADEAQEAMKLVVAQYEKGAVDFTRVTQLQQTLVQQQNDLAQAKGEIARGLIQVYKGLGGGWRYSRAEMAPPANILGAPEVLPPN